MYNVAYTCQGAVSKLQQVQRTSNTEGWSEVDVCTVAEKGSLKPKLKCRLCGSHLTVSNPAQSMKTHLTESACSGKRRAAAAVQVAASVAAAALPAAASAAGGAGGVGSGGGGGSSTSHNTSKRKKGSGGFDIMIASASQQQCFEKSLARFFFKNGIALQLTEDPDLKAAVAHVGLAPPSRHTLSNKLLDEEYNAVLRVDTARLAQQRYIQFSSDGWRRRAAAQGKPLINFLALMAAGKPVFCKVVSAAGVVKDQQWIAARHVEWAAEFTNGDLDRVLGFVMDNTKANM